ncbi:MAG: hypothetical protein K2W95_07395 [Candidatus Obscuribacterales bacterium]|nr:hypothetical protein [Candidatus Obscuribacterales bacterium]
MLSPRHFVAFLGKQLPLKVAGLSLALSLSACGLSGLACMAAPERSLCAQDNRIYAAPLLEKGNAAWITIYDKQGLPSANALVSINGNTERADRQGVCNFTVPDADSLRLCVVDQDGHALSQPVEFKNSGNLLVLDEAVSGAFTRLIELAGTDLGPRLIYTPPVVDKRSSFLVVGKNFAGAFNQDRISLEGRDADVFAGSSVCLLARAPEKTSLGPLKEIFVMSSGEASNSREVDVCRLDSIRRDSDDAAKCQIRVIVSGTNMPCIFEISASEPAKLRLRGRGVGSTATVVSPGGDRNHVVFEIDGSNNPSASTVLLADPLLEPALSSSTQGNIRPLTLELDKAQTTRLRRRYVALDLRLQEAQERRKKAMDTASTDEGEQADSAQNEIRAISLRKDRLSRMLAAQRALIEGVGGTTEDFNAAISLADAGTGIDMEAALRKFDVFGKSTTVAKAERRKIKVDSANDSFPSAGEHIAAPMFAKQFRPHAKETQVLTSLTPVSGRLIAPPKPYVPDIQDMQSYMAATYLSAPPVVILRPEVPAKSTRQTRLGSRKASANMSAFRNGRGAPALGSSAKAASRSRKHSPGTRNPGGRNKKRK